MKISGLIAVQKKKYLSLPSAFTKWSERSQKLARINLKVQNLFSVCATNCAGVKPGSRFRDRGTEFFSYSELPPSYFLYQKSNGHLILVNAISVFTGFRIPCRS